MIGAKIILLVLTTCSFVACLVIAAENLEKLEKYLVENVSGMDLDENLIAAQEYYDNKSSLRRAFSSSTGSVKTFTLLASALHGEKCTSLSYKIIKNNYDLFYGSTEGQNLKRMRAIFDRVSEIHGEECARRIIRNEEEIFDNQLDMKTVYLVNDYTDAAMRNLRNNEYMLRHNLVDYQDVIGQLSKQPVESVWNDYYNEDQYPVEVLKGLQRVTEGTDDETWTSSNLRQEKGSFAYGKDYFREMYKKYIVKPCEYYVRELKDIYTQWDENNKYYKPDLSRHIEFNYHYYRFQICKHLIQNDKEKLFNAILKHL